MPYKYEVTVSQQFNVTLDGAKFTETFLAEFREHFYPFTTLNEHAEHIAQMFARGLYDLGDPSVFVEGYGKLDEAGIKVESVPCSVSADATAVA